jgi:hypothetical protein
MALEQSPEFKSYLDMLRIFAYGTLSEYRANPSLPPIDDMQVQHRNRTASARKTWHHIWTSFGSLEYVLFFKGSR